MSNINAMKACIWAADKLLLFPDFPAKFDGEFRRTYNFQSIAVIRRMAWIGAFLVSAFSVADFFMDNVHGTKTAFIRLTISIIILGSSRLPKGILELYLQSIVGFLVIAVAIGLLAVSMMIPGIRANAGEIIVAGNLLLLIFNFGLLRLLFVPAMLAGVAVLLQFNVLLSFVDHPLPIIIRGNMHILFAVLAGSWVSYKLESLARQQFLVIKENATLISQLYPGDILEWAKSGKKDAIGETNATVVFIDIVESTKLAQILESPQQLVQMLHEIFTGLDQIANRYNVHKIKTIGDGYMAVSGAQVTPEDNTQSVVDFALESVEFVREYGRNQEEFSPQEFELSVRVGIHRGRVVSGLIGVEKRYFDLWGRTVNLASRIESYSDPGKVAVSAAVRHRLRDLYVFEDRPKIDMKGVGPVESFFVVGRRTDANSADRAAVEVLSR